MEKNNRKRQQQHKNVGILKRKIREKYQEKVAAKEKRLGRPLTKKEKNEISNKILKSIGLRISASALALATTFGVGYKLGSGIKELPEGGDRETSSIVTQDESQQNEQDAASFRDGLRVEIPVEVPSNDIETEINDIGSREEMLNWLKDFYIDKYEEITGKDSGLTPSSIKILDKRVSSIYLTSEGEYITQLETPFTTEKLLEEKGVTWKEYKTENVYMVLMNDGTVIDCANGLGQVILSEYYDVMKDSESALPEMIPVLSKGFELMDLYKELEDYQSERHQYNEFIGNKIEEAKKELISIIQRQGQEKETTVESTQDVGVEPGD